MAISAPSPAGSGPDGKLPGSLAHLLQGDSPTPLYHQIFSWLRDQIVSGELPHGAQVPTEFELADTFAVSRITSKRALDELAAEGLVERRRGRGTHVIHRSAPRPTRAPLTGLLENLEILAENTDVTLLSFEHASPPIAVQELFDIESDEVLAHAVRMRSRGGTPFGHYVSWTRTTHAEFNGTSLAKTSRIKLFKRCGIRLAQVEQTLSAVSAEATVAKLLGVESGSALLTLERRSFDSEGQLVDLLMIQYRPDHFRYQMTLDIDADGHAS